MSRISFPSLTKVLWHHLTIKPEISRTLFDRYLLGHLQTNGHQTWQGGRGWAQKGPRETRFHGNHNVVMATMARSRLLLDIRLPVTSQPMTLRHM